MLNLLLILHIAALWAFVHVQMSKNATSYEELDLASRNALAAMSRGGPRRLSDNP